MDILWTLIIGGIAGWLAGTIYKGGGFGIVGNIIIGLIGSLVGYFVFGALGLGAEGSWGYLVVSTIGAVILLALVGLVKRGA